MNREQKLEAALKRISDGTGDTTSVMMIAKEALAPQLTPKKGNLYMFRSFTDDHSDDTNDEVLDFFIKELSPDGSRNPYTYEGVIGYYHTVRELTETEWLDVGAPYIEVTAEPDGHWKNECERLFSRNLELREAIEKIRDERE